MSALRADNRHLNQTVSELRSERRAQDRKLRDLKKQLDLVRAQVGIATVDGSMPSLPVEVASPDRPTTATSRVVAVTDDGEEIVYEGDAAAGKVATIEDDPSRRTTMPLPARSMPGSTTGDRIELSHRIPAVSARTARTPRRDHDTPPDRTGDASNDYRAAVDLVKAGNHDDAVAALRAFLAKYPRHDYADNAQYWLGEAFYAHKDYAQALIEFRNVIQTYPRGNKVPDALLKVGYCYQALTQTEKARAVLEQVVNLYPKTEPAALAAKRLETP
ncbi:MAG: tol-pal system protein YbgF [Deltaproteobacteria bacterium]|nr:tol-pal system protein YbgF [Deltaproteobacteria bacterium]